MATLLTIYSFVDSEKPSSVPLDMIIRSLFVIVDSDYALER